MKRVLASALLVLAGLFGQQTARAGIVTIEDFEDGTLNDYTAQGPGSGQTADVIGAAAHDGNFGLHLRGPRYFISNDSSMNVGQGQKIFVWVNLRNVFVGRATFTFGSSQAMPGYSINLFNTPLIPFHPGTFSIEKNQSFTAHVTLASAVQGFANNHWYEIEIDWGVGGSIDAKLFDSNGTTLLKSISAQDNSVTSGTIGFQGFQGDVYFDTVQATTVPEPSSLILAGVGAISLCGYGYRRWKQAAVPAQS